MKKEKRKLMKNRRMLIRLVIIRLIIMKWFFRKGQTLVAQYRKIDMMRSMNR